MAEHRNVTTVNRMTEAIVTGDRATLETIFTRDFVFHLRGPYAGAGDHAGVDGLLGVMGGLVETTGGDIKLEQLCCLATDQWATEWEHCVLGRKGATLESDNSFVYRFEGERIAEMWMFLGADPAAAATFFA